MYRQLIHYYPAIQRTSNTTCCEPPTGHQPKEQRAIVGLIVGRTTDAFGVLDEHNMTVHFKPKFADLRNYEYMRFPLELRYGLTDRWELQGGFVPFTPNVFNRGVQHRWGLGEGTLGARYDIRNPFGSEIPKDPARRLVGWKFLVNQPQHVRARRDLVDHLESTADLRQAIREARWIDVRGEDVSNPVLLHVAEQTRLVVSGQPPLDHNLPARVVGEGCFFHSRDHRVVR